MIAIHNNKWKGVAAKLNLELPLMFERLTIWGVCKILGNNNWHGTGIIVSLRCMTMIKNKLILLYRSGNKWVICNRWDKSGIRNQQRRKQGFKLFTLRSVGNQEPTLCRWQFRIYTLCVWVLICLSKYRNRQHTSKRISVTDRKWPKNKGWIHMEKR
jgi:hypothetical protein